MRISGVLLLAQPNNKCLRPHAQRTVFNTDLGAHGQMVSGGNLPAVLVNDQRAHGFVKHISARVYTRDNDRDGYGPDACSAGLPSSHLHSFFTLPSAAEGLIITESRPRNNRSCTHRWQGSVFLPSSDVFAYPLSLPALPALGEIPAESLGPSELTRHAYFASSFRFQIDDSQGWQGQFHVAGLVLPGEWNGLAARRVR